ncbi:Uncharacterised protein [uncultured archaeon]|nr:Uncharacterised protein [uncultured archaeon]
MDYELMTNIYEGMRKLSSGSDALDTLASKSLPRENGIYAYNLITTNKDKGYHGISGRIKLWKEKILPYFFSLPAVEMAKEKGLELKVSNNIFRSRIVIYDKESRSKFKVKAPWLTSLFSRFFGSFVKSRLREYTPSYS